MSYPQISIVTITFNSERYVEKTIQSVIKQTYPHKEYIIIDGASTDSTLNIIQKYESSIDYWISEPDKGISDAMNKGLKAAKGDFILFLHSDDFLSSDESLENASKHLNDSYDTYLFNIFYFENGDKTLLKPRGFNWWINFKTGVLHQGTFCSLALFDKVGNFDTNFSIPMDYDFFLRAYRLGAKAKSVDMPLSVMRKTGISFKTDWASLKKRFSEEKQVHEKNCNNFMLAILYKVFWFLYPAYRYILFSYKKRLHQ